MPMAFVSAGSTTDSITSGFIPMRKKEQQAIKVPAGRPIA